MPDKSFPLQVAAIDVGSNAIRLVAAEFSAPATFSSLFDERVPVRLGHDVFIKGRLADEAAAAAVAALSRFRARLDAAGIGKFRAVATSAVREASNGEQFVKRVREEAGIDLEVITGSEEARLVHVAVRSRVPLVGGRWVLVDLGGGSVEVSLVDHDRIHLSESHTMGSVRLLEELSAAGDEPGRFHRLLEEYTATLRFPHAIAGEPVQGLIATGGNIETLVRLGNAASGTDGVPALPVASLRSVIERLSALSFRQRVDELGLREDRADVILPAAMVYERVALLARADTILVPQVGVKEGVLIDQADDLSSHRGHTDRLDQQAYAAALTLGRRYQFDEPHGVHVAELAVQLFRQLTKLHRLDDQDGRILRVAALLHDVGIRVNHKKHHKHSHYLIANSDLTVFSPAEIQMVAAVARYHRKGEPAAHHPEFMALSEAHRARVVRLAALLRIAAALDKEQRQRVAGLRARVRDGSVVLELRATDDLVLERWALDRNKALFEKTFGTRLLVAATGAA